MQLRSLRHTSMNAYPFFILGLCLACASASASKPNLVTIIADDLGYFDRRGAGNVNVSTPGLDALYAEGVNLRRYYGYKYCSPSRRAFVTGRLPVHLGELNQLKDGIDLRMKTLGNKLKAAGYTNTLIGKTHWGVASDLHLPIHRGWDKHIGYLGGGEAYATGRICVNESTNCDVYETQLDFWHDAAPAEKKYLGNYSTFLFTSLAVDAIEAHDADADKPFWLHLNYQAVHNPQTSPPGEPHRGDDGSQVFYQVLEAMDAGIQRVVAALKKNELWDSTLVVFVSDNGAASNGNNYPLRAGKYSPFEGGVRNAACLSGGFLPDHVAGTVYEEIVHVSDFFPTLCGLSGLGSDKCRDDPPSQDPKQWFYPVDGKDFWPAVLSNGTSPWKDSPLVLSSTVTSGKGGGAMVLNQHKIVLDVPNDGWDLPANAQKSSPSAPGNTTCADGSHKKGCKVCTIEKPCVFDVVADPSEVHNIASTSPDLLKKLNDTYRKLVFQRRMPEALKFNTGNGFDCASTVPTPSPCGNKRWGCFNGPECVCTKPPCFHFLHENMDDTEAAEAVTTSAVLKTTAGQRFRIQALSCTLLRVEAEAEDGSFEDRPTFLVQNRSWEGIPLKASSDKTSASTDCYSVSVGGSGKAALELRNAAGVVVWQGPSLASVDSKPDMPNPSDVFPVWSIRDRPRFAVPAEGPVPSGIGGFDFSKQVDDAYFFVAPSSSTSAASSGYSALRSDVLALTGPVPLLPDFVAGLWFTWYHNYTAAEKLREIDEFKARGFSLDVASLDMDWRLHPCYPNSLTPNCTDTPPETERHYVINTELLPDMAGFLREAHQRNVSVFFNDHPMTPTQPAHTNFTETSPAEIRYRYDGLTSLLKLGLDFWWFDCHWHELIPGIQCPGKSSNCDDGIDYATWGQYVFFSIMQQYHAEQKTGKRTIMLGCSGREHRALHRTPLHWTGDNHYDELALGIQQTVDGGINLRPWVHQDCGSHHGPGSVLSPLEFPAEVYVRWVQYCSASNVARLHSDPALSRLPWAFGDEAEGIAKHFFAMRKALRPTLVAAARRAHDEGVPVVRRCDLEWPALAKEGAADSQQYLLADDLLVRPVDPFLGIPILNATTRTYAPPGGKWNRDVNVWLPPGEWHDAFSGETHTSPGKGMNLTMKNVPQDRMPMFHRGGGMIVTKHEAEMRVHVWPTAAACNAASEQAGAMMMQAKTRPVVRRKVYASSTLDPAGDMAPWIATKREAADGTGFEFEVEVGGFAVEEDEASSVWAVYVHLPKGVDAAATALVCDGGVKVETTVLTAKAEDEDEKGTMMAPPFSSSVVGALPMANEVVEAKMDLSRLATTAVGREQVLQCRFGCRGER